MDLPFTHRPGRRERHLRRRHESPLFAWPPQEVAPEDLLEAQRLDHEEMVAFAAEFRALVQRAVELPPNAGSDLVLALKADLERAYERSFGLPEDHRQERKAIKRLIDLTMKAVRGAAGQDSLALSELDEEAQAREIHFRLLEQPLVADLLHPESPIDPQELPASVLASGPEEVSAVLELFSPAELDELAQGCARLVAGLESKGAIPPAASERLGLILARAAAPAVGVH